MNNEEAKKTLRTENENNAAATDAKVNTENQTDKAQADKAQAAPAAANPAEEIDISRGKLALAEPFMANNAEITELEYDFKKLTGKDFVAAMDSDKDGRLGNPYEMTNNQAMAVFARACVKQMPGKIDIVDVTEGLGYLDAITAIQASKVFFKVSSREGSKRLSKL